MRALLLIGSPRGDRSTSASLGRYLLDLLGQQGWEVKERHLQKVTRSPEWELGLSNEVSSSDLVVFSFPTYVDSIPAGMVKVMSVLAQQRSGSKAKAPLVAIANCGFHEAEQNSTALEMCRLFARDAGFVWKGGLALGSGPAIGGRPLAQTGRLGRNARRSLEMAAKALVDGKVVPEEAVEIMARPGIPGWLYLLFANRGWRSQARKNGVLGSLYDRPYTGVKK
jgi:multimeric flavodoxin WrbA